MDKVFANLYFKIQSYKKLFFILFFLFLGGTIFLATKINFEEDISKILPKGEKNNEVAKILNQLNFSDKITVIISTIAEDEKEKLSEVTEIFLDSLESDSTYFSEIQGKIDNEQMEETFSFVYEHLPLFLDENDYSQLEKRLTKDSIDSRMQNNYNTLISPTGIVARDFILKDPLGLSFIGLNKLRELGVSEEFIIFNGYITSADTSSQLLFITPAFSGTDSKQNEVFVEHLYEYQRQINETYKDRIEISYYGAPFIALANANQIKSDIKSTVVLSITVLMLILILFYRKLLIPIILFTPAISGAAFALAIIYLINPSISMISVSIGAILLGVTLDYSIHVITHFREHADIRELYRIITKPLLGCSITTSIAFLCLLMVKSEVLQDLGIFASISIISASLFALILIPHLYIPAEIKRTSLIDKIGAHHFEKNYLLIGLATVTILLGLFSFSKVRFNNNISDLNFVPENMRISEEKLENLGSFGAKSVYLTVYGGDLETILKKNTAIQQKLVNFKQEGKIEDFNSIGSVILSEEEQVQKIENWNQFWAQQNPDSIGERINTAAIGLGFKENTFKEANEILTKNYSAITVNQYEELDAIPLDEFLIAKEEFITLSTLIKTDEEHYDFVMQQFDEEGVLLIDRKHISEQFLGQIKDDFKDLMNYSLIIVFVILFLFFRRIELAFMGIIPIVLTGIVTTGFVYLFNLELNIFSTIVTTLILGIGVDFSIFMTSGLQKRYTTGVNELKTYRISIILAVLTTVLSIGVLIFAKHPALKSISWISLIGITSAMLITFSVYPLLFKLFVESRPKKGKAPATFRLFITAVISHTYFGLGSLIVSIVGVLVTLLPFRRNKTKRRLRIVIGKFTKSVMYSNYGVKNVFKNPHNEDFKKPAIYVANHSSFSDTLSIGFLPIDYTFVVNDWVYHSPIFGKAIQAAGYFPVANGIQNLDKNLINQIKGGTSIVVFPEGTRSFTGEMARFKKGVFLLAQMYNIDIIPLYIHGNTHNLPKGDFVIFDRNHILEVGERINIQEEFGDVEVKEITKQISERFRKRFAEIRKENENEDYFKQKIELNFLYKLLEVEKRGKAEFDENKSLYYQLNDYIDKKAEILRIGNDLGVWDLLLLFQEPRRKVQSYIVETENRNIAKQSFIAKNEHWNLSYVEQLEKNDADTLIISTKVDDKSLISVLEKNFIQKIIITADSINFDLFDKFGYELTLKESSFSIFKRT